MPGEHAGGGDIVFPVLTSEKNDTLRKYTINSWQCSSPMVHITRVFVARIANNSKII